jgi:hypothetical protein
MVYVFTTYMHTACILMAHMHTEYIPHTGTYAIKRMAYVSTEHIDMANMSRACIWHTSAYKIYVYKI